MLDLDPVLVIVADFVGVIVGEILCVDDGVLDGDDVKEEVAVDPEGRSEGETEDEAAGDRVGVSVGDAGARLKTADATGTSKVEDGGGREGAIGGEFEREGSLEEEAEAVAVRVGERVALSVRVGDGEREEDRVWDGGREELGEGEVEVD